jgi:hypothetical protein
MTTATSRTKTTKPAQLTAYELMEAEKLRKALLPPAYSIVTRKAINAEVIRCLQLLGVDLTKPTGAGTVRVELDINHGYKAILKTEKEVYTSRFYAEIEHAVEAALPRMLRARYAYLQ